jgi:hypothetical protein
MCYLPVDDAYYSLAPDPTFAFVGGPCNHSLDFAFSFCIMITFNILLTSLFYVLRFPNYLYTGYMHLKTMNNGYFFVYISYLLLILDNPFVVG